MIQNYMKTTKENIKLHKGEEYFYEVQHPEIFNCLEQRRIRKELMKIKEDTLLKEKVTCLDIASGTGNLVRHLRSAGFKVVACDLSARAQNLTYCIQK